MMALTALGDRISLLVAGIVSSYFLLLIGAIHSASGRFLRRRVHWTTLFAFTEDMNDDATAVVRVESTMGFQERVQGHFLFQQYGTSNLFRIVINGHLPPSTEDTDNGVNSKTKGQRVDGAINLPDGVVWNTVHKKVKSNNNTAIRGRSSRVFCASNVTGVLAIQVSFIHYSPKGKCISTSFQEVIDKATMASNSGITGDGDAYP
jgi:hypothetical protein